MRHFGIYSDSSELEQAYQNGDIINPYVALVNGNLDYDTQQPCLIGKWSDNGEGTYTFQILDTGDTAWLGAVNIGSLADVYFNGDGPINMDVTIGFDGISDWTLTFVEPNESANPGCTVGAGSSFDWTCDEVMTDPNSSTAQVQVSWNGTDTFEFFQSAPDEPDLSMNTINPECSEEGPSE